MLELLGPLSALFLSLSLSLSLSAYVPMCSCWLMVIRNEQKAEEAFSTTFFLSFDASLCSDDAVTGIPVKADTNHKEQRGWRGGAETEGFENHGD